MGLALLTVLSMAISSAHAACDADEKPSVRFSDGEISVTFCASEAINECDQDCFVGLTARRAKDAFHFDLPVMEVTEKQLASPITISGNVGKDAVQYVVGVWLEKSTCTTGRHGCEAYGYRVNEPVWSFPEDAYNWHHLHDFAEIYPSRIQLLDAGGGAPLKKKVKAALEGHQTDIIDGGKADTTQNEIQVLYRARWDRGRAWSLALTLKEEDVGYHWTVKHWPDAPERFVVAVGGP
jgi:hypothetical protein